MKVNYICCQHGIDLCGKGSADTFIERVDIVYK